MAPQLSSPRLSTDTATTSLEPTSRNANIQVSFGDVPVQYAEVMEDNENRLATDPRFIPNRQTVDTASVRNQNEALPGYHTHPIHVSFNAEYIPVRHSAEAFFLESTCDQCLPVMLSNTLQFGTMLKHPVEAPRRSTPSKRHSINS